MAVSNIDSQLSLRSKRNYWLIWEISVNVLLALFFLQFVVFNGGHLLESFRLSTLLMLVKVSADTLFHLVRSPAKQISVNVYHWAIAVCGTNVVLFFRSTDGTDMLIGDVIQIIGCALQVAGMVSINRSIGYVAANRGIKTKGMYRFVRHPLYFAYNIAFFGFLINHFTAQNCIVYVTMVFVLYLRTICEEAVLMQDQEYQAYSNRVRYRLIPYIV